MDDVVEQIMARDGENWSRLTRSANDPKPTISFYSESNIPEEKVELWLAIQEHHW